MKDNNSKIKRIILCRLGGIGDVIHTLPLVKYLKKKYINASVEYVTSHNVAELLSSCCPYIDRVWTFDKRNINNLKAEMLSKSSTVDYFFNLHSSLKFFFFNLFNTRAKKYFQYKKDNSLHAVINFAKTYDPAISGLHLDSKTLFAESAHDVLSKYDLKEGKYVCFVPGVGKMRTHRAMFVDNWQSIIKKFLSYEKDFKAVLMGGGDEERLKGYFSDVGSRVVNLIGELSLSDCAKIISSSSCLVSCDTGLLHMACALSKKVIGLYGPTLPLRSGPYTGDYEVLMAKDCKCKSALWDIKKCKLTKELSGYCMNDLNINEILSRISHGSFSVC